MTAPHDDGREGQLQEWTGRVARGRSRLHELHRAPVDSSGSAQLAALEELGLTYEELSVAEEELRAQNEQLEVVHQTLTEEHARYRELFLSAPWPYFTTDENGSIREANFAAGALLGIRPSHLQRKPFVVFTKGKSRRRVRDAIARLCTTESNVSFVANIRAREDEIIRVLVNGVAVTNPSSNEREFRWQLIDQRPQLRRERARARRSARLERVVAERTAELTRAQTLKDQLVATVSHELRTPLAAFAGYLEILGSELHGPLNEDQHRDISRLERAYKHMTGVVDDLLGYNRLAAGRLVLDIGDVIVADQLHAVVDFVAAEALSRTISLALELPSMELVARGDPERFRQIILNLLANAVKFTPVGGQITVRAGERKGSAFVEVEDTGPGIPERDREAIFEPFFRLPVSSNTKGIGLGLAIARQLARAMQGSLTVGAARHGEGSCFMLCLPLGTRLASDAAS